VNPESWGFIGTLVGTFIGASSSILTTRISSRSAIRIQEEAERNARKERYREFQRNNLLELQVKLTYCMRLVGKAYIEYLDNYKNSKDWGSSLLSYELDNEIENCFRELSIKTERVDQNELRTEIINFRKLMIECLMARTHESVKQKQLILFDTFEKVMPKLGKELRENY